ncbi:S-layer homology domain-containing protein [Paenibacillus dauci]|uniref:S-layer homology domain-containing protein n=1 Tax=Paenibacillus dauci TaxID=1567106 RepID=UPI0006196D01|nr:S-layer homology domain-containing protein [Paenibacillus dauci]
MSNARGIRKSMLLLLSFLLVITLPSGFFSGASTASAATNGNYAWTQRFPATVPAGRTAPLMAYNPATGKVLMFGGYVGGSTNQLNDTWQWDGTNWQQLSPTNVPNRRSGGGMAYDPISQRIIMFGGDSPSGYLGDTWAWTGSNWQQLSPAHNPTPRGTPYMATDQTRNNIVLFGGITGSGRSNETWTWNGSDWIIQSPATLPSARNFGQMTYDPVSGNLLMFGGNATSGYLNDTWTWNGTNWAQQAPSTSPPIRMAYGLAYDGANVILFGGEIPGSGQMTGDTWFWTGSTWTQRNLTTSVRGHIGMLYDPTHDQILSFGGFGSSGAIINETWTLQAAPLVATGAATLLTSRSVQLAGEVQLEGKTPVVEKGIVVTRTANNTVTRYASTQTGIGAFTVKPTNLLPSTSYTYRAYAVDAYGTTYAAQTQAFTTNAIPPLTLDSNAYNLKLGTTHQTTVQAVYEETGELYTVTSGVTFSSANPGIASVNATGLVTGNTQGNTVITAVYNGSSAQAAVNVTYTPPVITNLSTNQTEYTLKQGDTQQTVIQAVYDDGSVKTVTQEVYYSSSNPNVASVRAGGLITAVGKGAATITAQYGGKSLGINVTVTVDPVVTNLFTNQTEYTLKKGTTQQTVIQAVYDDGTVKTVTQDVYYSSSNPNVASVRAGGLITAAGKGTATITAQYGGKSLGINVTVTADPVVTSLSTDRTEYTIRQRDTEQTVIQAVYDDGTVKTITEGLTYTSSNPGVATVDANGLIRAVNAGTAAIVADYQGKTVTINVTVTSRRDDDNNNSSGGGGGGGSNTTPGDTGGTTPTTPSSPTTETPLADPVTKETIATVIREQQNGIPVVRIRVNSNQAIQSLDNSDRNRLVIPAPTDVSNVRTELDGTLAKWLDDRNGTVEIQSERGQYILPAKQMNVTALTSQNNTAANLQNLQYTITISPAGTAQSQGLQSAASTRNVKLIDATTTNFGVTASMDGAQVTVPNFEQYAQRLIPLPEGFDPSRITTGIIYNEDQSSFMHVPTRVTQIGDRYYAQINSLVSNGTYALIENEKSFADVANHWGRTAIEDMASRMVVEGVSQASFEPNRNITRAEFAAVAVRAFGLVDRQGAGRSFSDVAGGSWYQDYVGTAADYGLLTGYADGTFKPDRNISREEAIAILVRAIQLANIDTSTGSSASLQAYRDANQVSGWASSAVGFAAQQGIVQGNAGLLNTDSPVNRAETAALMERILTFAKLI